MGCGRPCSPWLGLALGLVLCRASRAQQHNGTTMEHKHADPWPYSNPPWEFGLESSYFFLGLRPINGTHPPDNVPDPNVTFVSVPGTVPSSFAISRYSSSPWGPWDQLVVQGSICRVNNGPPIPRFTQAFASVIPPTLPSNPVHVPHRLARFEWTTHSYGGKDLKIYSPSNSTTPVLYIQGLKYVPGVTFPVTFDTFKSLGLDTSFVQSIVPSYEPLGTVTGHVKNEILYEATGGVALYSSYETLEGQLDLDGGFFNVGGYVGKGKARLTADPYNSK